MIISNDHTIAEIQSKFNKRFPGLKVEFYSNKHDDQNGSALTDQHSSDRTLGDVAMKKASGEINFSATKTVGELENEFETHFDLHMQIFRRSNDLWLQTSITDDWTLEVEDRK